ncbi:class I SAM-dependent methyltransferase [Saccharothrix yanglingensis]|uniref:SAM-dependent methyltransferase n=1 Tax=Saccharothrix yanglingensis TaxID=659496 RepID=A0ABU0X8R4_9PSEU|nr:class I SAM-dependent methyltransferase [Saccharothrix yanglingensis]MDQ2588523.1 SAM-dependent methyltransferase [Saccharothrix yanglingensis]
MDLGFRGEVAALYRRYRRGYPPPVVDVLVDAFTLTRDDVVVDLGCGTGQLAVPLAGRVRGVVGVDPEPDMLAEARAAAGDLPNATWVVGSDADVPALRAVLGTGSVGAVTIGQALHWMDRERLFAELKTLVRPGGGVAVVTNGTPLWQQGSGWSRALGAFLRDHLGPGGDRACGTDEESQRQYAAALSAAGYDVTATTVEYTAPLTADAIAGGVLSALPVDRLPADRAAFTAALENAVAPHAPFAEDVRVAVLTGRRG